MTHRTLALATLTILALGCGSGANDGSGGGQSTGTQSGPGGTQSNGAQSSGTASGGAGGGTSSCDAFGHFGASKSSFTLPTQDGQAIAYDDVQKSFPNVDWMTIDRLYIPAGHYKSLDIGNLPTRAKATPLIITNQGGQVAVGPNDPGANYLWSMTGGANWILTGRYDPDSGTGDAGFVGHRCGAYGTSRGHYGFMSDDGFATGQYLHMGVAITEATDFQVEYVEVTRSGFAGFRLLNSRASGDPEHPMANVTVNDNYVHDTFGEGFYFGWTGDPPSNLFPNLQIYQNRIIRTGNETLQIQDLGDGSEVHNNVFAWGSLHWRDNGLGQYQDNNSQILVRQGTIQVHHNIFTGGASTLLNFFSSPETGDGDRHVTFHDDYFGETKSLGPYLGGSATSGSDFNFVNDFFHGLDFSYDVLYPTAKDPGVVFGINNYTAPVNFTGNTWEGTRKLVAGIDGTDGTHDEITAMGNKNQAVTPLSFVDSGYPNGTPFQKLEVWAPVATLSPNMAPITYAVGDVVMDNAKLYQCTAQNTGMEPSAHPEDWMELPLPNDDLRLTPDSPYATFGVH